MKFFLAVIENSHGKGLLQTRYGKEIFDTQEEAQEVINRERSAFKYDANFYVKEIEL